MPYCPVISNIDYSKAIILKCYRSHLREKRVIVDLLLFKYAFEKNTFVDSVNFLKCLVQSILRVLVVSRQVHTLKPPSSLV